jgi:hypothetical protein
VVRPGVARCAAAGSSRACHRSGSSASRSTSPPPTSRPDTSAYFAGAELVELFPLVNLIGNVTLGVAALSYAGQFNAMVVADADAYPDLGVFGTGMAGGLDGLA